MEALIDRLKDRGTRRNTDNITEQGRKDGPRLLIGPTNLSARLPHPGRFHRLLTSGSTSFLRNLESVAVIRALLLSPNDSARAPHISQMKSSCRVKVPQVSLHHTLIRGDARATGYCFMDTSISSSSLESGTTVFSYVAYLRVTKLAPPLYPT
ncbi:hypothetical protein BDR04DRAFT_10992 [Suillus decipiens]|nr:hypothetical protein BDR04DRAFT_10992 [Suillus decipiens]